jgi:hypothetical protein
MRPAVLLTPILVALLAGCTDGAPGPAQSSLPLLEGWILDVRLAPVVGARVTAVGVDGGSVTDEGGHYAFDVPAGIQVLVVAEMQGFVAQSRAVSAGSGDHLIVNFTLDRVPAEEPYRTVESFEGILHCGVVVVALEDPSRPHQHTGVRCSMVTDDDQNVWSYTVPPTTTGLVIECVWEPQSDLAQSLLLNVSVQATGEVLGFQEGISPLRAQTSRVKLDLERRAGHDVLDITIESGAGTGNHEHGAVGATAEQTFRLFVTAFYNGPVDPGYSVTQGTGPG